MLGLLNLLNPFTLIGVIVAAFLLNIGRGSSKAMKTLKSQVEKHAVENVSDQAEQQAKDLADRITYKLSEVKEQIIGSVSKELSDLDNQVKTIIEEKEKGEISVKTRKKSLDESEKRIHELNVKLDKLIFTLVEAR